MIRHCDFAEPSCRTNSGLSRLSRGVIRFILPFLSVFVVDPTRSQNFDPPKDCYFACKEQFNVLAEFRDSTSPDQIKKVFGDPLPSTRRGYQIAQYRGAALDFFMLKRKQALSGVAIIVKGKTDHARVPFMDSSPENNVASAFPLQKVSENCHPASGSEASPKIDRGNLTIYAPCWGAKPGSYKEYGFVYLSTAAGATPQIITVGVSEGSDVLGITETVLEQGLRR
jgi:hypothetical protein